MYKTAIFADLHLQNNEPIGGVDQNGINLRTKDKISYLNTVIDYAVDNKLNSIINAGDLFDTPTPSNKLKTMVSKALQKALQNNIKVYIIGGNHETTDNKYYNLMSESSYNDGLIFCKSTSVDTENGIILKIISSGQEESIAKMKPITPTILIGHFQIEGAKFDNERLCTDFVKQSDLSSFLAVYCGHFHKRQQNSNWKYVGALCRNNFGESKNESGFLHLSISDGHVKETFINIEDKSFVYKKDINVSTEEDVIEFIKQSIKENSICKFVFKIPEGMKLRRRYIKEISDSFKPFHCAIEYEYIKDKKIYSISKELNYEQTILEYSEYKKLTKKLIKVGIDISKEVF